MPRFEFDLGYQLYIFLTVMSIAMAAHSQETPPTAAIRNVSLSGAGCPQSSAQVSFSPDFKDLSILFDNYYLEAGKGTANPNDVVLEKPCKVDIDMYVPQGWQFAFESVDYRGFAALPPSVLGFHRFTFVMPNSPVSSVQDARMRGPFNSNYYFRAAVRKERLVYSPCGQQDIRMTLHSTLGIQFPNRGGNYPFAQLALDSSDMSIQQALQMTWRRCTVGSPEPRPPGNPNRPPRYPGPPVQPVPIRPSPR